MSEEARETGEGYPFSFRCERSGNCCSRPGGVVKVTDDEIVAIAGYLGLAPEAFRSRYLDPSGRRLREGIGPGCVFLESGRPSACSIHSVRPEKCRTWPFWPELRDDPAVLEEAQRFCPGIRSF